MDELPAATHPLAPMVSVTKCCRTFHSQASSFCCPYTTVCGRRAWCRMPGKELPSSLFWNLVEIARRQVVKDRSASVVACVRQRSAWWTVVWCGSRRAENVSPGPSEGSGAIDLLLTTWWTWNTTYKTHSCCANIPSLSSLTWRRLTTPAVGVVSSEPYTAGMSGVIYHCFFLTSRRPDIFASGLEMFCLPVIPPRNGVRQGSVLSVALFAVRWT
jgi:hypothetical protein